MGYDPANYCAEHCPGGPPTDQPCLGKGHAPPSRCVTCETYERMALARQEREERRVFIHIEQRRDDPEFMRRLQRDMPDRSA